MVNKTAAMAVASAELGGVLPLASLNHISIVCRSVEKSLNFYMNVLGFNPIRRPGSFDFSGAWLFNYGIGIHLLQAEDPDSLPEKTEINPKDNHISFQGLAIMGKLPPYSLLPCRCHPHPPHTTTLLLVGVAPSEGRWQPPPIATSTSHVAADIEDSPLLLHPTSPVAACLPPWLPQWWRLRIRLLLQKKLYWMTTSQTIHRESFML